MRFEKIEVNNYRQYRSLVLDFTKTQSTDLHVVIASNGIGKTNLLNAIDWCLYEEESHLGDKDDSLSICNLDALAEARASGNTNAVVSVKITATEGTTRLAFERSVSVSCVSKFPGRPRFQVSQTLASGNTEIVEDVAAADIVNHYLPKKIRQYFFFDGEQLYNYFGKAQSTTHVKDSIYEIAQINVVSRVKKELDALASECQRQISRLNPASERISNTITQKEAEVGKLQDEIIMLENSLHEAQDTIDELSLKIAGTEEVVDIEKQYQITCRDLEGKEKEKETLENDLIAFAKRYYILLMLYPANSVTNQYISEKDDAGSLPPDIDRDLLIESLKNHKCAVCNQEIGNDCEHHIEELLEKFKVSSAVSNKLMEIKNDVFRSVGSVNSYQVEKEALFKKMRDLDAKIAELEEIKSQLYLKMSRCSSIEDVKLWVKQRDDNKRLMQANSEKIGSYKNQINRLEKEVEIQEAKLRESYADQHKCDALREKYEYARKAFEIVRDIEEEIIREVRNRMESETFETFSNLIWKHNTYGRIELNDDYKLRLFHIKGDSCLGSCSAAERELLALAFTLALHRVSHHDSLLFIDTPVGRVSDQNREFFAKALISVSEEKQLILAFTPSEYSDEISKYFGGFVHNRGWTSPPEGPKCCS